MLACPFLLASWVLLASSNKLSQVSSSILPAIHLTILLFCRPVILLSPPPPILLSKHHNIKKSWYLAILPSYYTSIPPILPACHPAILPSCHPVIMPTCHPAILSTCQLVILPSCHPAILSSCHLAILPSILPSILSSSHPAILPSYHTVTPSWHPAILTSCHPDILPSWHPAIVTSCHLVILPSCRLAILPIYYSAFLPFCYAAILLSCYPALSLSYCLAILLSCHISLLPCCSSPVTVLTSLFLLFFYLTFILSWQFAIMFSVFHPPFLKFCCLTVLSFGHSIPTCRFSICIILNSEDQFFWRLPYITEISLFIKKKPGVINPPPPFPHRHLFSPPPCQPVILSSRHFPSCHLAEINAIPSPAEETCLFLTSHLSKFCSLYLLLRKLNDPRKNWMSRVMPRFEWCCSLGHIFSFF